MAILFPFEVYTPSRLFFSEMIEAIVLALLDGEAAVYAKHAPFTAPVVPCVLRIKDKEGAWKTAFASEGILEVTDAKTVLVVDAAEWPEEIDRERAGKAMEKAEEILRSGGMKFETDKAASSLRRAQMRMKAAGVKSTGV